ncbi:hypothetical protein DWZ54_02215 [Mitsuokella sp. AF33-22]|nr:hypothetical protein DWZ54_02215 [Mitsuokella sp. AF33-22]
MHVRTRRKNLLSECVLLLFYYGAGKKAIALRAIDARQWPLGLQGKRGSGDMRTTLREVGLLNRFLTQGANASLMSTYPLLKSPCSVCF